MVAVTPQQRSIHSFSRFPRQGHTVTSRLPEKNMIHVISIFVLFLAETGSQLGYSVRNRKGGGVLCILLLTTCTVDADLGTSKGQ